MRVVTFFWGGELTGGPRGDIKGRHSRLFTLLGRTSFACQGRIVNRDGLCRLCIRSFLGNRCCDSRQSTTKGGQRQGGVNVLEKVLAGHGSLIRLFFSGVLFTPGHVSRLLHLFGAAGTSSNLGRRPSGPHPRAGLPTLSLNDFLGSGRLDLVTRYTGRTRLFAAPIGTNVLHSLLRNALRRPLGSTGGQLMTFFFSQLYRRHLVLKH